jgi:hypothetical protein
MRAYGGVDKQLHTFLISERVEFRWPVSGSAQFAPGNGKLVTYWLGGWWAWN